VTRRLRVFAIGGFLSYRALFGWLNPYLFVIILLVPSVTQMLFFVYLGRSAGVANDTFYVVGNAVVAAAVPGLFGMADTITDERYTHTLSLLVVSPASRLAVFLGRGLPVMAIGVAVSLASFSFGALVLDVEMSWSSLPLLVLTMAAAAFSCTALGVAHAAIALRVRELAVFSNIVFAVLLVFCGVNVPLDDLPGWMSTVAEGLPLTHGIEAARRVAEGDSVGSVAGLIGAELLVGLVYVVAGMLLLRFFESQSRRNATLETA
jgi:ABC-2 type transport system permease protein